MNDSTLTTLLSRSATGSVLTTPSDLGALPWPIRFSLADLFAQARFGEQVALACARTILELENAPDARAFAATQVRDEARHLAYFDQTLAALRVERPVMAPLVQLFTTASRQTSLASLLLANHLIVESLAHDLFSDVAKRLQALGQWVWLPRPWGVALRDVAGSMMSIARDESRHVAFGVLRLSQLRDQMNSEERAHLDLLANHWFSSLARTLDQLPVLFLFRSVKGDIVRAVLQRCRQRVLDVGIEVA